MYNKIQVVNIYASSTQGTVFVIRMMYRTDFEHVISWYFASRVLLRTVNPHLESLECFPELVMYKKGMLYIPTEYGI